MLGSIRNVQTFDVLLCGDLQFALGGVGILVGEDLDVAALGVEIEVALCREELDAALGDEGAPGVLDGQDEAPPSGEVGVLAGDQGQVVPGAQDVAGGGGAQDAAGTVEKTVEKRLSFRPLA